MLSAVFWNVCLFYLFFLCGANKPLRAIDLLFVSHFLQSFPSDGKFISYILYLSRNDLKCFPIFSCFNAPATVLPYPENKCYGYCSSFDFGSFRRINVWSNTSEVYIMYDSPHLRLILRMTQHIWSLYYVWFTTSEAYLMALIMQSIDMSKHKTTTL